MWHEVNLASAGILNCHCLSSDGKDKVLVERVLKVNLVVSKEVKLNNQILMESKKTFYRFVNHFILYALKF